MSTVDIVAFLDQHDIAHETFEHAAVFTVEESSRLPRMPGTGTKNLLLRDKKELKTFLVTLGHAKTVDLKALKDLLGVDKLSFASPERLKELLGVEPGSVTLLGLIHDPAHVIDVIIDEDVWQAAAVQCHPLRNTATTVLSHEGLEAFLRATGHRFQVIQVPAKQ